MAFYPIHQTYGQLSGSIFYAASQTKLYRNIGIFSALLSVLFAFTFIYIFELGAVGLALTMLIVQVIGTNIQLYFKVFLRSFFSKKRPAGGTSLLSCRQL